MVVIARKQSTPLVQGRAADDLYLRVVGSSRHGEIARLSADKCTIGSAPGCTMRLRARGVQPVHCVLLRGARGTVLRAWAPSTRLNGRPVEDAFLLPGDHLVVGPIEFEVLPLAPGESSTQPQSTARPTNDSAAVQRQITIARRRSRKLITTLRELRQQLGELKGQLRTVAGISDDSTLREREEDLVRRHEALRQQRHDWEASCQRVQDELDSRTRNFSMQFEELEIAKNQADEHNRRWQHERDQTHAAWEAERENHTRELASLHGARETLDRERTIWSSTLAETQAQIERERAELAALHQQTEQRLAADEQQLAASGEHLTAQHQATEQRLAEREQQLTAAGGLLAAQREQLEADRQAANERRGRWQQDQDQLERDRASLTDLQQRLRHDQEHVGAERQTIADIQRQCQQTRDAVERDLLAIADQQQKWEQERHQWQLDVQNQSLSHAKELDSLRLARDAFEQERTTWAANIASANTELAQQRQAFVAQRETTSADYHARQQRLAAELEQFERDRQLLSELEQTVKQDSEQLTRQRASLAEQQQLLTEQVASQQVEDGDQESNSLALESLRQLQAHFTQEQRRWSATVADARAELDRERSLILEQGQALTEQRDELDRRRSQAMKQIESQLARLEHEQRNWHDWQTIENARMAEEWTTIEDHLSELRDGQEAFEALQHAAERDRERMTAELTAARDTIEHERAELRKLLMKDR